jgi:restriction endonuclease
MIEENVQNTVKSFYVQMHKWESDCARRELECENGSIDYEESERIAMNQYRKIFSDHCSAGATPREYFYSEPVDYDPDQLEFERVESADNDLVSVYVRVPADPNERFIYRLVREEDGWRICEKIFVSSIGEMIEANL